MLIATVHRLAISLLLAGTFAASAWGAENSTFNAAMATIVADDLQRHADVLADDTFEGREGGSRGGRAAAGYIVDKLEKLQVAGASADGQYYQTFGNGYRNILAQIPGSDPRLASEVILIGAHYDHVGYGTASNSFGPTGFIHNGADDNASGTAALLEVIEAFVQLPEPPARTVVFAFWDCEEKGLLGSKHFVGQPTFPLASIKLLINLDMVGRLRNNTLKVFGSRTGFGLRRFVSQQNADGLLLDFDREIKENSDHHPFYSRNIPYLMLHTDLHDDYHRPRDDSDKLNAAGMQQVARLAFSLAAEGASAPTSIAFRSAVRGEPQTARAAVPPKAPPRLGVTWKNELELNRGLKLLSVIDGTPAHKAGLQIGDRIVSFNGRAIASEDEFRRAILAASGPFQLGLDREAESEPLNLQVEPAGKPVRVGISWQEDSAEPGTLIVIQTVTGSPAAQAGLRVGDRIYAIAGEPFTDGETFRQRVLSLAGPLELQIERNGQLRTAVLELAESPVANDSQSGR